MTPPAPAEQDAHRLERQVRAAVQRLVQQGRLPDAAEAAPLWPPLVELLWAHRATPDDEWTRRMASDLACACFGEHHLWQDLGLAGRHEVSALLMRHFPALAEGNTRGLRWKRYFFLRLGQTMGIDDLAPPRCEGCDDQAHCFPPADPAATVVPILPAS